MDQDTENRVERRRRRRRGIVALLGAISMLTIGAGSISLAQFTDTAGATWNFTAGTIDISVNPTAFAAINPMMPGDVNTQAADRDERRHRPSSATRCRRRRPTPSAPRSS